MIATNCIKHSSIYPTFENIRYVSDETLKTRFRAELKPNDILFVNKGTPGRVCLVPDPITFCVAQDMIGLRADSKKYITSIPPITKERLFYLRMMCGIFPVWDLTDL